MKATSPLSSLRPSVQLVFALAIALSFFAYLAIPAGEAEAVSCPPGWSSCEPYYNYECCQHWPNPSLFVHRQQECTEWDHDIDAYPTCTYKVVREWTNHVCTWTPC